MKSNGKVRRIERNWWNIKKKDWIDGNSSKNFIQILFSGSFNLIAYHSQLFFSQCFFLIDLDQLIHQIKYHQKRTTFFNYDNLKRESLTLIAVGWHYYENVGE